MKLIINGREKEFSEDFRTVGTLLKQLKLGEKKLVIERNGKILVSHTQHEEPLSNGDKLEIVHFVGGG